ncbi:MAG: CARDB domain-containing protein [bacterium]|nr:CARDB domain-containing protein [bacterium]
MKQNHPSIHFGKIISLIVFVAVAFSMLGAPSTSPVVAQEPTPTADGDVSGQIVGPDLVVTSLEVQSPDVELDSDIYENDDVFVFMDVKNLGDSPAGAYTINIYVDGTPIACTDTNRKYYFESAGLEAGAIDFPELRIPAGGILAAGPHTITVYADSDCAVTEINESNNILTAEFTVHEVPVDAPEHDNVENAKEVTTLPYTDTVNVRGATRHATDPTNISCTLSDGTPVNRIAGLASVWYQYTATANTTIAVDTFGSNYDTYIAAWQGLPDTTLLGCNDDSGSVFQSSLALNVTNGTTYYFEVAQYSNDITNVMTAASVDGKSSPDVEAQAASKTLIFNISQGYEISGNVGASGVTLSYFDGFAKTVTSDANGDYGIIVPSGWSGTVTPSKSGRTFIPASRTYTNVTTDLTGQNYILRTPPADFNGDGKTDIAVFRPLQGRWWVKDQFSVVYGMNGDIPVPGDYNGDGKTDVAVFRPSQGRWWVKDQFSVVYGMNGDIPVPGDYNGNGETDVAVFRPSQGRWWVKDQFSVVYGMNGDIPIPRPIGRITSP